MKTASVFLIPLLMACTSTQNEDQQEKRDCERMTTTGSHVPRRVCKSEQERRQETEDSQELYLRIQPVPKKPGGNDF